MVKHEAMAIRSARLRLLGAPEADLEAHEAIHVCGPWERAAERERAHRSLAALAALKPAEARALVLQAAGRSYPEIEAETGWTQTKVNRALTEGRAAFRARGRRSRPARSASATPRCCRPWCAPARRPTD